MFNLFNPPPPPSVIRLYGNPQAQHDAARKLVRPWEVESLIDRNVSPLVALLNPPIADQVARWLRGQFASGQLSYISDPEGFLDYWCSPAVTLQRRGGDCEDLALLSLSIILAAGGSAQLAVGTLWNGRTADGHAWVEGQDAQGGFVLEATSGDLYRHWRPAQYTLSRLITPGVG